MAKSSGRLVSLDIFRGLTIAFLIIVNNPGSWEFVYAPLKHAKWKIHSEDFKTNCCYFWTRIISDNISRVWKRLFYSENYGSASADCPGLWIWIIVMPLNKARLPLDSCSNTSFALLGSACILWRDRSLQPWRQLCTKT